MELNNLIKSSNIAGIKEYLIKNPKAINKIYGVRRYINQTPLLCAVESSDIETVMLLLDYGANANMYVAYRYSALGRSTQGINNSSRDLEMTKLLLEHGANPNLKDDYSPNALFYAVRCNFHKAVLMLLDYDAHCGGKDIETTTLVEKIKLLNIKN